MVEAQEKILAYDNQFHEFGTQTVEGVDCISTPFPVIAPENNLVTLKLTQGELRELMSSIQIGAEWAYPDKSHQILFNFMKGLICPPEFEAEESGCDNYPNYASFITYTPSNPFNQPDFIPPDYEVPPFLVNSELEYPSSFGYLTTDVFVPFAAITISPENFLSLNYPTIKISVVGSGQIELDLLSVAFGGYAVIKIGSPPNILDILGEVIIESGLRIVDLDNDSTSIPPETDIIIAEEVNIEAAAGVVTEVYIVFLPKLNDSIIPLGFGGGIRQIGLCGFESVGSETGVEDVRFNTLTCTFEKRVAGAWSPIVGGDEWLDCVPASGGGGGGGSVATKVYRLGNIGFGTITTTSTTYVDMTGLTLNHTPTKANMLVIVDNILMLNSAGNQPVTVRILADGNAGLDAVEQAVTNSAQTDIAIADRWVVAPDVEIAIKLQWKTPSGTATRYERSSINVTIIEYDDSASGVFVEDVRILDRELQKKIGGVWVTVTESLAAIFDSIDSQLASIVSTNASQQAAINNAAAVNATQTAQIAAHELRLDDIDLSIADIDLSIAGLGAITDGHEIRLDALEAASSSSSYWSQTFDFTASDGGWVANGGGVGSYGAGQGWQSENGLGILEIRLPSLFAADGRITHMNARLRADNALGALPNTYLIKFPFDGGIGNRYVASTGTTSDGWYKVENIDENYLYVLRIEMAIGAIDYTLRTLRFLGKGDNPFS